MYERGRETNTLFHEPKVHEDCLAELYKELSELIGLESMLKLYVVLKGQQINFPTRLYAGEKVRAKIYQTYDGESSHKLAREYGYSSRWMQQIVKEYREEKENEKMGH
ncbi:Uncharacterized conserved protein [Listeria grayi]|nr:Uncharacterized conserved protein [Listeria grayi]